MNRRGLTMLELTVSVVVGAVVTVIVVRGMASAYLLQGAAIRYWESHGNLVRASEDILTYARLGTGCTKSAQQLECDVDLGRAEPTGVTTTFRFRQTVDGLVKEKSDGGAPATWTLVERYPSITALDLCDGADITGGACAINGAALNTACNNFCRADLTSRFFRVQLTAKIEPAISNTLPQLQFAVLRRNPGPNGLVYLWGEH